MVTDPLTQYFYLISFKEDVVDITLRPLYFWESTPVPLEQEAGWAPESVWMFWKKVLCPCRDSNPISLPSLVILPARLTGNQCTPLDKRTVKNFPPRP